MNLKNCRNYCSFFDSSRYSAIRVRTRTCVFSASGSSTHRNHHPRLRLFCRSSNSNFMDEYRFFTISCKLDFHLQCFEVLLNFSQTASSCGLFIPWCFYQRSHFFWLNSFQNVFTHRFRRLFIKLQTQLFTLACNCSVDTELIC